MIEMLSQLRGEELAAIFMFAGMAIIGLVSILLTAWQRHRDRELAVVIIQDMLDQGMSADQIEGVLNAAGFNADKMKWQALGRKRSALKHAGQTSS
jgi:hypothetical protein